MQKEAEKKLKYKICLNEFIQLCIDSLCLFY